MMRSFSVFSNDADSPVVKPSSSQIERKIPSVPIKPGSSTRKGSSTPSDLGTPVYGTPDSGSGAIQPRALHGDLEGTDAVAGLDHDIHMMNLVSPAAGLAAAGGGERRSSSLAFGVGDEANRKRPKTTRPLSLDDASMPPPQPLPGPVPLIGRQNTLQDTKILFSGRMRSSNSFSSLEVGSVPAFEEYYEWENLLGQGSFAQVHAVRSRRHPYERYAVKSSKQEFRTRGERAEYVHEVQLAYKMGSHSNIVEYISAWQEDKIFYMLMELCARGTLRQHVQRDAAEGALLRTPAHENQVWDIVLQISRGLAHMHSCGVVHLDIKPDNILMTADRALKIGDLGLACFLSEWREGMEGDPCYLSRDLLENRPSTAVDVFSMGMMVFEIVSGEQLCGQGDRWEALRTAASPDTPAVPSVPPPATCSSHLRALISEAMSPVAEARPTAQQLINATVARQVEAASSAHRASAS